MEFSTQPLENALIIIIEGRLDVNAAPEFDMRCTPLFGAGYSCLIVDVSGLEYVSSAGLRCFITLSKKARTSGCSIAFCGLTDMVREVFDISGMLGLFPIASTAELALKAAVR